MSDIKQELQSLHSELARVLKTHISKVYVDEDGKELPPPAAILNVARQFLKDNNIDAVPTEGTPLAALAEALPFSGETEVH